MSSSHDEAWNDGEDSGSPAIFRFFVTLAENELRFIEPKWLRIYLPVKAGMPLTPIYFIHSFIHFISFRSFTYVIHSFISFISFHSDAQPAEVRERPR